MRGQRFGEDHKLGVDAAPVAHGLHRHYKALSLTVVWELVRAPHELFDAGKLCCHSLRLRVRLVLFHGLEFVVLEISQQGSGGLGRFAPSNP